VLDKNKLKDILVKSYLESNFKGMPYLPDIVKKVEGKSGQKFRCFLNNILNKAGSEAKYLEIGLYHGSTSIAALYNNIQTIKDYWLIDNWSQFDGVKETFITNFKTVFQSPPKIIDNDCFKIDPIQHGIADVNIYFYDGDHSPTSHFQALQHYYTSFAKSFIYIVDDWSRSDIEYYTLYSIEQQKFTIEYFNEVKYPTLCENKDDWWNGVGMFVLSKSNCTS
jgi:hypothetical protein